MEVVGFQERVCKLNLVFFFLLAGLKYLKNLKKSIFYWQSEFHVLFLFHLFLPEISLFDGVKRRDLSFWHIR